MTTLVQRQLDVDTLHLAEGDHDGPDNGDPGEMCLLEAAAWMAGEPWSDHPACVCPVLAAFGRRLNDLLPDDRRQALKPWLIPMLGTAGDGHTETRRYMALDWAVRVATPMWLDAADQTGRAATLRALAPITTPETRATMRPVLRQISNDMWELRRTKLAEIRQRSAAAAAAAAADAVAAAAADAVAAAAADAVAAAAADAAAAAAADAAAAAAAAWHDTYNKTYAAVRARIEERFAPTIAAVHDSAIALFGRMVRPETGAA